MHQAGAHRNRQVGERRRWRRVTHPARAGVRGDGAQGARRDARFGVRRRLGRVRRGTDVRGAVARAQDRRHGDLGPRPAEAQPRRPSRAAVLHSHQGAVGGAHARAHGRGTGAWHFVEEGGN